MAQFTYLGTTVTNQNLILEEIRRLNSGNACLLPFNPERFVLSAVQKHTQDYNFACDSVWLQNLFSDIDGKNTVGVFESRFGSKRGEVTRVEKTT
jgi:hypothetical protein